MNTLVTFVVTMITMLGFDVIWLSTMASRFYKPRLGALMADVPQLFPALIFYLIYVLGVVTFVVKPALKNELGIGSVAMSGALFGLVAYATYDLTNQATLKGWPVLVTVVDLIWGMILTGVVSLIVVVVMRRLG